MVTLDTLVNADELMEADGFKKEVLLKDKVVILVQPLKALAFIM